MKSFTSKFNTLVARIRKKESKFKKFLEKHLTRKNITKILIIFIVGFIGRAFINEVFDISVFKDYCHIISLAFYGFMSIIAVFFDELSLMFSFTSIKNFLIPYIKLFLIKDFIKCPFPEKIKNLRNFISTLCTSFDKDKITVGGDDSHKKKAYKCIDPLKSTPLRMDNSNNQAETANNQTGTANNQAGIANNQTGTSNIRIITTINQDGTSSSQIIITNNQAGIANHPVNINFGNPIHNIPTDIVEYNKRVYDHCRVLQPNNIDRTIERDQYLEQLTNYMREAVEFEKRINRNPTFHYRGVRLNRIGLTRDNSSYISEAIVRNPNSYAYTQLTRGRVNNRSIGNVRITRAIYTIIDRTEVPLERNNR